MALNNEIPRQAHAVIDLKSRHPKALKIERILDLQPTTQPLQLLEIGCGSGGIAHYFGTHPNLKCKVEAVDVHDNRQVFEGYRYTPVEDVVLPYESNYFDVVVTNHVIEHVGDEAAQLKHLTEINRVLKPHGQAYLAVPNRWMLIEPHYRLALLSWWPRSWRSPYLRLMGKGKFYDCEPLQFSKLERMLRRTGFDFENKSVQAWRETFEIERPESRATRWLRAIPDGPLNTLRRIIPTLIYRLSPQKK